MNKEQVKIEETTNVWDREVPVEKSSYLHDHFVQYLNMEHFHHDPTKLAMMDLFCGAGGFAVGASWAGFESVVGIDHLQPAMETWMHNHPNAIGCLGDISNLIIRQQRNFMQNQFATKAAGKTANEMSPLTAVRRIPTEFLLNYLSRYENAGYRIGELLKSREYTELYQVNVQFRGDPYPGALAAIDYLTCREGKTFEDRKDNLVLVFGELEVDNSARSLRIKNAKGSTIADFFADVQNSEKHNLLVKEYSHLRNVDIPRYLMQVRYGSTYSKVKHIRVYSYFSDAILFPDGSLWRDG